MSEPRQPWRPPRAHLVMRFTPRGEHKPARLSEKIARGPLLEVQHSRLRRAAEAYWASPSEPLLHEMLELIRPLGAWLTTPAAEYDEVWVVDPKEVATWQGTEKMVAPIGTRFAKRRRVRDAAYRKLEGKKVLGLVAGGYGDLIFLSQVARALREQRGCTLEVAGYPETGSPELMRKLFGSFHPLPMPETQWRTYDYVQPLGIYRIVVGETLPEYVFRIFGVRFDARGFDIDADAYERVRFRLQHRHGLRLGEEPLIFIQPHCRPDKRYAHMEQVASLLVARGHKVVLIGGRADSVMLDEPGKLANLCGVDVWDSLQAMRHASAVLTPDSAFLHAAGCWGKPTVAVFGPSPVLWAQPYESVTSVTLPSACRFAPCWVHQGDMPPCGIWADRPCLAQMPPHLIAELVEAKLGGREHRRIVELPIVPKQQIVVAKT